MIFRTQQGRVAALNRWGGKLKYLLMAYTLSNTCAKNLCKWTLLVQMIIKNVVTFFLEHSVYGHTLKSPLSLWDTGLTSTCWRLRAEAMGYEQLVQGWCAGASIPGFKRTTFRSQVWCPIARLPHHPEATVPPVKGKFIPEIKNWDDFDILWPTFLYL